MAGPETKVKNGQTPLALSWSLVSGFAAWGADLGASYALQRHACAVDGLFSLHMVTAICLGLALSGLPVGWVFYRSLPADKSEEGGRPYDRAHFQALLGMGFSLAFAVVILAEAVPRWFLQPCY
jgi:hypothetical protein